MTVQWPVSRTRRSGFAPPVILQAPPLLLPARRKAVQPIQAPAAPTPLVKALESLPAPSKATLITALNGASHAPVAKRSRKAVQAPAPVQATPLPARSPPASLPQPRGRDEGAAKATPPRPAGTAIRDAADARIVQLRGQIRQDAAALSNSAAAIGRRIEAGETPRQEGEFMQVAHRLDQNCASLYECLRLTRLY
jgi:hypothetical protein